MKEESNQLRRVLVALAVFFLIFSWHGFQLLEAASTPIVTEMPVSEPQIPEYDLVVAQRRQVALERISRIQLWEEEEVLHELSAVQHQQMRRENEQREEQLAQIAQLVPEEFQQMVLDIAGQYGVDPRIVAAVGRVESRWNPLTYGSHGDTGLMQVLPSTAEWIASRIGMSEYDLFDPYTNLTMGIWYLHVLYDEYGSWDNALAAYNGGPTHAPMGASHPYVQRVRQFYDWN